MTNPWARIVGPCFTGASIAEALSLSEAEVQVRTAQLQLLALETDEEVLFYPAFQVHEGRVIDGLEAVLRVLQTGVDDPWTWAQWLNTSVPHDDPPRMIDALRAGHLDIVLLSARDDAASWSS